ncbi:transglycosylase SLT domain-containing protein [uncultured Halomonas sp.]|uniref:transglycosylase SLT domain-containing protein n=1 Tax=uncultured Halomonas sp. TaxID=173971 RepID=UPI0026129DAE|nr:transglycosylase SLT domain-containing protein [uncultured Halomonas sp.]
MRSRTATLIAITLVTAGIFYMIGFLNGTSTGERMIHTARQEIEYQKRVASRADDVAEAWKLRNERLTTELAELSTQKENLASQYASLYAEHTTLSEQHAQLVNARKVSTTRRASLSPQVPRSSRGTGSVEQWRELTEKYFGDNTDAALSVMAGESAGDPNARNKSGASGLMQQMEQYWPERSAAAGFAGASIYDPEANIAVSAMLSKGGTDWSHWSVKP